jgi:hypothetical protein
MGYDAAALAAILGQGQNKVSRSSKIADDHLTLNSKIRVLLIP